MNDVGYSNPVSLITATLAYQNWTSEYQVILNSILELSWNSPAGEDTYDLLIDELKYGAQVMSLSLLGRWGSGIRTINERIMSRTSQL